MPELASWRFRVQMFLDRALNRFRVDIVVGGKPHGLPILDKDELRRLMLDVEECRNGVAEGRVSITSTWKTSGVSEGADPKNLASRSAAPQETGQAVLCL